MDDEITQLREENLRLHAALLQQQEFYKEFMSKTGKYLASVVKDIGEKNENDKKD